ncbi:MAG: SEL1-like repeat protein [Myxococcota bacterium]
MGLRVVWCVAVVMVVAGCSSGRASTRAGGPPDACRGAAPRPCAIEGRRLLTSDLVRGRNMLEAACRRGDGIACDDSAVDFKGDPKRAYELTHYGCDTLGRELSCRNLGVLFERGDGVEQDRERALGIYVGACARGDAKACRFAGNLHNDKTMGAQYSKNEALKRYTKACHGKDAVGCSFVISLADELDAPLSPTDRMVILQHACADGNGWGCYQLGLQERSLNIPDAVRTLQKGCDWNDASACDLAAALWWKAGQNASAMNAAMRGCAIDRASGCWREGLIAAAERKYGYAVQTWEAACGQNDGRSCRSAGLMYLNGQGVSLDGAKARDFFTRACELKNAQGCETLGWQLASGTLIAKDTKAALKAMERACELGRCFELGSAQFNGTLGPKNLAQARATFEKGCASDDVNACNSAGWMFYEKIGLPRDPGKAATLFSKACDLGNQLACSNLAEALVKGEGVIQNKERAVALWETASKTEPSALAAVGDWLDQGWGGTPRDPKRALEYYERACERGWAKGCTDANRVARSLRVVTAAKPVVAAPPKEAAAPKGPPTQLALPDFGKMLSGF